MVPSGMTSRMSGLPCSARAIASAADKVPETGTAVQRLTAAGSNSTDVPVTRAIARRDSDSGWAGVSIR